VWRRKRARERGPGYGDTWTGMARTRQLRAAPTSAGAATTGEDGGGAGDAGTDS
jgi:hypothetical protein